MSVHVVCYKRHKFRIMNDIHCFHFFLPDISSHEYIHDFCTQKILYVSLQKHSIAVSEKNIKFYFNRFELIISFLFYCRSIAMWNINLEEYVESFAAEDDEFISPQMMAPIERMPDEVIHKQQELVQENEVRSHCNEITRLLQNTPGILQPVERFSKSYVKPKPEKLPSIILDDRIPIFLGEEYFRFPKDPKPQVDNDDQVSGYTKSSDNDKSKEKIKESEFWTVFDDDDFDQNKATPAQMVDDALANQMPRFYSPKEVYMMKRNKNTK